MTSKNLINVIFSQELEVGVMRCDLLGYQMTLDFGLDHVHVKPSLSQESKKDLMMKDTSGQFSQNSLKSANLQSFLESRLKQQLNTDGSILFKMTWKSMATPAHRRYCLLRALAHRTSDIGFIGGGSWPTRVNTEEKGNRTWNKTGQNHLLAHVIKGMATPRVFNWKEKPSMEYLTGRKDGKLRDDTLVNQAMLINNWRTQTVSDAEGGIPKAAYERNLKDYRSTLKNSYLAISTFGAVPSGGLGKMEKSAQLNPGLSRWLMGFPPEWDVCAVMAMQSFPK